MKYRVAEGPDDYMECHALMRAEGLEPIEIAFPTIMAVDDSDSIVGFLGTIPDREMVMAGPLVISSEGPPRPFTARQLGAMYDRAMRNMQISSYVFGIAKNASSGLIRAIEAMGMTSYAEDEDHTYYIRRLDETSWN